MSSTEEAIAKVKNSFAEVDASGSGYVTDDQVAAVLMGIGSFTGEDITSLLSLAKRDASGKVDYGAFIDWLMGGSSTEMANRLPYCQATLKLPDNMGDLNMEESVKDDHFKRKCKIICTMGPSCWDVDKLVTLIDCGLNICRLNFSHGDHEGHGACLGRIREAADQRPEKQPAVLLDTKGPEIRTGFFAAGGKVELKAGQDLKLVVDYEFKGDSTCFAVTYQALPTAVKPGGSILIADGSLVLKVKSCGDDHVICEVMNNCSLGERKNCNLPGVKVDLPVLQEKDIDDLVNFGIPQGVDFVAASFVQCAADVKLIRATLGEAGKNIKIISKIENQEGLVNFDEICDETDGVMVARGDLGMEIPPEKVFMCQKVMVAKCNVKGTFVITATQMLESMGNAPRPTRAEAGDVANAVLDGTDCVMLSGETAGGNFPVESVSVMRRIVEEAEGTLDYFSVMVKTRLGVLGATGHMDEAEATCSSAVKTAFDVRAGCIVVLSKTGSAAANISKYRPPCPILMGSTQEQPLRQCNCLRGVVPVPMPEGKTTDERIKLMTDRATAAGIIGPGGIIIVVHGQDGATNLIKLVTAPGEAPAAVKTGGDVKTYSQCPMLLPRNMGDINMIESQKDSYGRKCKIICTMGPSCWAVDMLVKLIDSGCNICRLNFSHGDHEAHGACVDRIKEADAKRPNKPTAILLDTKGPEIRTGFFAAGGKIDLKAGQDLKLVTDYEFKGDSTSFAVTYDKINTAVKPGGSILVADGSLVLKVKSCGDDHVMCEVMNDCSLGERKNCNLPGVKVELPVLQEKDIDDIQNFGIPRKVQFVAASFVQSAADVQLIRDALGEEGKNIKIISKIENQEGLVNFDEICEASDGIMVARGDLGMEIPPEKVFLAQKIMIAKCNIHGKPVVCATQMLESMGNAPRPTRAEAGDVANAVLDGCDAVMLSGETAGGNFPLEAVSVMRRIVEEAEANLDYLSLYYKTREAVLSRSPLGISLAESMASTACKSAADINAPLILCFTGHAGSTVRLVSKYRPKATIIAVTDSEAVARSLMNMRGVYAFIDPKKSEDQVEVVALRVIAWAKSIGMPGMVSKKAVVVISEQREGQQGAGVNSKLCKLIKIP